MCICTSVMRCSRPGVALGPHSVSVTPITSHIPLCPSLKCMCRRRRPDFAHRSSSQEYVLYPLPTMLTSMPAVHSRCVFSCHHPIACLTSCRIIHLRSSSFCLIHASMPCAHLISRHLGLSICCSTHILVLLTYSFSSPSSGSLNEGSCYT